MTHEKAWQKTTNILCFRPDNMGDVLMTTPALRALKEQNPTRSITLLTSQAGSIISSFIPEIDDVITFDFPWIKSPAQHADSSELAALIELLKKRSFDGAIIFTTFSQNPLPSSLVSFLADIPLRLAYCHENPYQLLTNWIPDPEPQEYILHEVERQLKLVEKIGATTDNTRLSLVLAEHAKEDALTKLAKTGVNPLKPWFVLHPGVSSEKRRYKEDGFIEAGKKLADELGYQVVVTGTPSEQHLAESIAKRIGEQAFSVAGKLSLEEFLGVIAASPLLISNNTGPVHIAAALNTPVVDLYALTNPQHTPWQVPNRVLYFPVAEHLRQNIVCDLPPHNAQLLTSPQDIVTAAKELLHECQAIQPTKQGDYA